MKKWAMGIIALVLVMICTYALADVDINDTNFPDGIFRAFIQGEFDKDQDGKLNDDEISKAAFVICEDLSIKSLKGIELLPELTLLNCRNNKLTALDLSNNPKLTYLSCDDNKLSTLILSRNQALTELNCSGNKLTVLDLSKNTKLESLSCYGNNISKLNISNCTVLTSLTCHENAISTLDVTHNTELKDLYCSSNPLTGLDVGKNSHLESLECGNNNLITLDVSRNTELTYLNCRGNRLTKLNVSKSTKLKSLDCSENQLTKLDVSKNTSLVRLWCTGNSLKSLDTSKNESLAEMDCGGNQLTSLNLSQNTDLEKLRCQQNNILNLDVSNCPELCDLVRNSKRVHEDDGDHFGSKYDLILDATVTVVAGDFVSKPTADPKTAIVKGLKYDLNSKKKTAVFTGLEDNNIKTLTIPDTVKVNDKTYKVTEIKAGACKNYTNLTQVTIGKNVSKIGKYAFSGCKNVKKFIIKTTKLTSKSVGSGAFKTGYRKTTVKCPKKKLDEYKVILLKKGLNKKAKFTK